MPLLIALPLAAALDTARELSLSDLLARSGFVGWTIVALAVATLALVVECYFALARDNLAPPAQLEELRRRFDAGNFGAALELCVAEPTYLARVVAAGLAKVERPFDEVVTALEERGEDEATRLHHKLGWISVAATVAPLLGLFGTVWGLAASFHALAAQANPSSAQLAGGVYVALATTLEGLAVALPAVVAFAYLRNRLVRALAEISGAVEDLFERVRERAPADVR